MRLHEHEDFAAFVTAAAEEEALSEQFVEKDYWITEILRVIAGTIPERAVFKGGTSLSKGWSLIDRFSEDVDLFVNPAVEPPLSRNAVTRVLKQLRDDVLAVRGLELGESHGSKGRDRRDTFHYKTRFPLSPGIPATVRLEPGIQSGHQPTADRDLTSIVAATLAARGVVPGLGVEGLDPFPMTLLHFRRTFVEKLFTIHGKVERLKTDGQLLGRDARHYADLYALADQDEVLAMLRSDEYEQIRLDYDENSRKHFGRGYRPPPDLRFQDSDALFPSEELRNLIEPGYEEECARLFVRPYPSFETVLARMAEIRDLL